MVLSHRVSTGDTFTSLNAKRQWQVRDEKRLVAVMPKELQERRCDYPRAHVKRVQSSSFPSLSPSFLAFISIHFHLLVVFAQEREEQKIREQWRIAWSRSKWVISAE